MDRRFCVRSEGGALPPHQATTLDTIERLKILAERYPSEPDALGHLGFHCQMAGEYETASEVYRRYLTLRPNDIEGLVRLGDCYRHRGMKRQARQVYLKANSLGPENPEMIETRIALTEAFPLKVVRGVTSHFGDFLSLARDGSFLKALTDDLVGFPLRLTLLRDIGMSAFLIYLSKHYLHQRAYLFPKLPCDLCGGNNLTPVFYHLHHKIVRCRNCGLEFVERKPPDGFDCERKFYEADDTIDYFETNWWHDPEHLEERMRLLRGAFEQAEIPFPSSPWRVFEFGCAEGQVLNYFKETGIEGAGLEASERLVHFARDHFGLQVRRGAISQFDPEPSQYDFVYSYHTVEHLDRPSLFFEKARSLLKENGLLFLEVPIPDLSKVSITEKLDPSAGYACMGHMHFFTEETVEKYLQRFGFHLLSKYSYPTPLPHGGFLAQMVRGGAPKPMSSGG